MSFWDRFRGVGAEDKSIGDIKASVPGAPQRFNTRWLGASQIVRSLQSWWAQVGSGTSDLNQGEQRTLRARSRDAMRNHLIARAALTRSRTNIVGTGLMCRPAVDFATLSLSADDAEKIDTQLRRSFDRWANDAMECDAEGTLDFYGLQSLTLLSAMMSGDCFSLTPYELRPGGITGLKVQLIEADRVENPSGEANRVGLYDGVVLSQIGQPIGVWIRSNHPGDSVIASNSPTWAYFDVIGQATGRRRVMHIWNDKERPGQVRGAPFLAPILEPLRQLSKWSENEMMAAVVSSLFTVFLEKQNDAIDADGNPITPFGGMPLPPVAQNQDGTSPDPTTFAPPAAATAISLGNGAIIDLPPGEKATFANPARPNAQFDPFFTAVVKQIGAGLELPLDELLLHYQSSYSAARAAMLQAWRFYMVRRTALAQQFCQPIYDLWLDEEVASGRVSLPGYADPIRRRAWSGAVWIGPARGAMDELKEAQAAKMRIEIGVSNETIECMAMTGESRDTVYDQQVREINQRKADGTWELRPTGAVRFTPQEDPNASPDTPSDPANVDVNSPDNETKDVQSKPKPVAVPAPPARPPIPPPKAPVK